MFKKKEQIEEPKKEEAVEEDIDSQIAELQEKKRLKQELLEKVPLPTDSEVDPKAIELNLKHLVRQINFKKEQIKTRLGREIDHNFKEGVKPAYLLKVEVELLLRDVNEYEKILLMNKYSQEQITSIEKEAMSEDKWK